MIVFIVSITLIVHSYIFYPLILIMMNVLKQTKKHSDIPNYGNPTVSIIISAFNEEKVIRQKIENILLLDYPKEKLEILIGSDYSTDRTNEIIKEYQSKGITLEKFQERRGKAAVLNDLVLKSRGEILVFSDANTFYDKEVIKKFVSHFSDSFIGGVCGYLQLQSADNNSGGKGESFYWEYENSIKELEGNILTTFGATGAIYSIRKSLFVPLPAHKLITDDFLIPMKVVEQGFRIVYDKEIIGWEETTESLSKEFQRKIRIGAANFNCLVDIYHMLNPKYGFIAFGLFSHKILRWFIPFLLFVVFLSSLILQNANDFILLILKIQFMFIGLSVIGFILDKISYPIKIFTLPYYFLVANIGLMIGFYRFIRGKQKATWNATR